MRKKIRVLICNSSSIFRKGIQALFRHEASSLEIVGEAQTARQAIEQAKRTQPDVVLMDVESPELSAVEAIRRMRAMRSRPIVLMLTLHDDGGGPDRCLDAGASGVISEDVSMSQLERRITALYHAHYRRAA